MGILDKLKSLVSDGGRQSSPSAYTPFQCNDCGHEFRSAAANPADIECPECGGTRIEHA